MNHLNGIARSMRLSSQRFHRDIITGTVILSVLLGYLQSDRMCAV